MAVTTTPRLGLKKYTAGTDPHPTRVEFNAHQDRLETMTTIPLQGTMAARPSAGTWGRLYYATDQSRMYWDTGSAWAEVTSVGGGGAGAGLAIGGSGAEGTSARTARADHTHPLPLATGSAHGAMSAADKAKLDGAVATATASRLVVRDAAGRIQVGTPAVAADAATKAYVDDAVNSAASSTHTHAWDQITGKPTTFSPSPHRHGWADLDGVPGTFTPSAHTHDAGQITGTLAAARLPLATATTQGAMAPGDRAALDGATSAPTASRLMARDAAGRVQVSAPSASADAATKAYVDGQVSTRAPSSHTHTWDQVAGKPTTFAPMTHTHSWAQVGVPADLDNRTSAATAGTVPVRNSSGVFAVGTPSGGADVANKAYVDGQVETRAPSAHTHDTMTSANGATLHVDTSGTLRARKADGSVWFNILEDGTTGYLMPAWGDIRDKPTLFPASGHTHSAASITSGTFDYDRVRGTTGPHSYAVAGSVPGTSYAVWVDGAGRLGRNTSSLRYKARVQDWTTDLDAVLSLEPRTYVRRDEDGAEPGPDAPRELGLIAEDVDQHLPELVVRDSEGRVDGLRYDLLGVALLPVVQDLARRVQDLEGER